MNNLSFEDGMKNYKVLLNKQTYKYFHALCTENYPYETGGILIGYYTDNNSCAVIEEVTKAPVDSRQTKTTFFRGTRNLSEKLKRLWDTSGIYYLGEWHFHPDSGIQPSRTDIEQMYEIANNKKYNCPEPILIILGGNPVNGDDLKIGVTLYKNKQKYITLKQK